MIEVTYEDQKPLTKENIPKLEKVLGYELQVHDEFYHPEYDEPNFDHLFYDVLLDADKAIQLDWKWDERELFSQLADVFPELQIKLISSEIENAESREEAVVHISFSIGSKEVKASINWLDGLIDFLDELNDTLKAGGDFQLIGYATGGDEYCWFKAKKTFSLLEFYGVVAPGLKWQQTPIPTKQHIADEVINEKIFYIPLLQFKGAKLLYLHDGNSFLDAYASRILPGETLNKALSNDLKKDFGYTGNFRVDEILLHDEAKDKQDKLIPRYRVKVELLGELGIEQAKPLGMKVEWNTTEKKRPKYRFDIQWDDSVTSDTFYILIRSSVLNDENKKSLWKIVEAWAYEGIEKGYGSDGYMHYIDDNPLWEIIDGKEYLEIYTDLGTIDTDIAIDELLQRLNNSDIPIEKVYFGEMIIGIKEKELAMSKENVNQSEDYKLFDNREVAINAWRKFAAQAEDPADLGGIMRPDLADNAELKEAERLFDGWYKEAREKAKAQSPEATLEVNFLATIFYIEAGFTGKDYLDEVANDWLMQDEQTAQENGYLDLYERIKQKREEINRMLEEDQAGLEPK
jgi:hypothetical protein